MKKLRIAPLLALALLTAACSDFATEPDRRPVELRVTAGSTELLTGDTLDYEIELLDEAGEPFGTIPSWAPPLWSANHPDRVDLSGGMVRPVKGGETTLSVELAGLTASLKVRANPAEMGISVPLIYITQSVQRPVGDVPVVAGRDGLLRVVVRGHDANFYRPRVRATFYNGGSVVHSTMLELEAVGLPTAVDEGRLDLSYDALISGAVLQPGVQLGLEVDPEGIMPVMAGTVLRVPETGTLDLNVRTVRPFRLMMVPVDQASNGRPSRLRPTTADRVTRLTREIFPLSEVTVELREPYVTESQLNTSQGWYDLIDEIVLLRMDDGNPHYYYGGFDRPPGTTLGGLGYVGFPVAIGMEDQADVIAHEVGHTLNLPHAPCGNPNNPDRNYPYPNGTVGVFGYEPATGWLKTPANYYDLMTYCDPIWISDYNYEKVLSYRDSNPYDAQFAEGAGGVEAGTAVRRPTLVVRGGVRDGRVVLAPALEWDAPVSLPEPGGDYTLEGLDAGGAVLFSMAVAPQRLDHHDAAHFALAIPAEMAQTDRLARLRLTGPEGVAERGRSSTARGRAARVTVQPRSRPGSAARGSAAVWDARDFPLAVVRDQRTGRIRAMSRTGTVTLPTDMAADQVEVLLSDGLGTHRADVVRR